MTCAQLSLSGRTPLAAAPSQSVHVDGVEDPLGELLELGRSAVRLLQEALIVFAQALDLNLQGRLGILLLQGREHSEHFPLLVAENFGRHVE